MLEARVSVLIELPRPSASSTEEIRLRSLSPSRSDMAHEAPGNRFSQQHGAHVGLTAEHEPLLFESSMPSGDSGQIGMQPSHESDSNFRSTHPTSLAQLQQFIGPWGPRLIEVFEQIVHPSFPICGDETFRDYREGNLTKFDPALLAALYIIASTHTPQHELQSGASLPSCQPLEDMAISLFQTSLARPTLSTVHAGVILMQHTGIDTKTLNTQLIEASHELGIHLDCSGWNLSRSELGLRKRLAWAIYMQDKWCSLIHGRPSSLSNNNWGVQALTDTEFDVDGDRGRDLDDDGVANLEIGRLLFTEMVSLTQILSTILETFYTVQAVQEVEAAGANGKLLILERAKPVQIRLKQWFANLPACLKIDHTTTVSSPSIAGLSSRCPIRTSSADSTRLPPPQLLCHGDHSPSQHHPCLWPSFINNTTDTILNSAHVTYTGNSQPILSIACQ